MKIKVALILFGVLLLNHPFLEAFEIKYQIGHIPVLILAVFGIWAAFILLFFLAYRKPGR